MVDGILRTNSGFMHDVDTLRSQLTDPETVISLGDRDWIWAERMLPPI